MALTHGVCDLCFLPDDGLVHEDEERCLACERWLTVFVAVLPVAGIPNPEANAELVLTLGSGELGDADGLGEEVGGGDELVGGDELPEPVGEDGEHVGDGEMSTQGGTTVEAPEVGTALCGMLEPLPAGWPPLLPLLPLLPGPVVEFDGDMTLGTSIAM